MEFKLINTSFVFLVRHLFMRIAGFFRHWYWDGLLKAVHWFLNLMERLDRIFALRITAKNWFQPLYQDFSIIGYVWGFIFRTIRIIIGLIFYLILFFIALFLFLLWATIPIFVIYKILNS